MSTASSVVVSTSLPNPRGTKNMAVLNLRDGLEMESEFVAVLKLVLKLVDVLNLMAETVGVLKLLERAAQGAGQMVAVLKLMDVPNLMDVLKLLQIVAVPKLGREIVGVLNLVDVLKLMDETVGVLKLVLLGVVVVV